MTTNKANEMSQCQVIGRPPVKTWTDYKIGCLDTFAGGHRSDGHLEAFQHGMLTVFNLLEAEFPPAELCKAAPEMLEALREVREGLVCQAHKCQAPVAGCDCWGCKTMWQIDAAIAKATGN